MKKNKAIVIMVCLLLAVTLGGIFALKTMGSMGTSASGSMVEKKENPVPPDGKNLEKLGLEPFTSELPVLMMDTKKQQILKEEVTWVDVAILDDESGRNDIYAMADDVLTAAVKYRGASSYSGFDKPQYRLKFYEKENGKSLEYDLFGLGADSEWVLNGPFLDRTLLRNYLMYNLAGEVMDWAPDCTFCELFIDGEYRGVYLAIEPITDGASRLRLGQFGLVSGATAYIVKRDRLGTEFNVLHTYGQTTGRTGQELSVQYPGQKGLTKKQLEWIERDISQFEEALYSDHFDDPKTGYAKYIDVDSFVEYFILNEFAMNHDAGVLSTYIYQELGGKKNLCVWDYNNGFDNYQWFKMETDAFCMTETYWFDRLLQDRAFVEKIEQRYAEMRAGSLSDENIRKVLDGGRESLGDAVDRNFALWGYTFENDLLGVSKGEPSRDPKSYDEALEQLETVIEERLEFLDDNISTLYKGCIN